MVLPSLEGLTILISFSDSFLNPVPCFINFQLVTRFKSYVPVERLITNYHALLLNIFTSWELNPLYNTRFLYEKWPQNIFLCIS